MKTIKFFEMSNIDSNPYVMNNTDTFLNMCHKWGIHVTKKNISFINANDDVYAVCKPGKAELVLSSDYKNLRKNFSKSKNR